jgi:hypothetical protein
MIQLPRRSVTRFFIPLIDVLTLMFCIFLLLPFVKQGGEAEAGNSGAPTAEPRPATDLSSLSPEELTRLIEKERRELERLRKEKSESLQQRLLLYVLEIDPTTGKLYVHDPARREITSAAAAQDLIRRQKEDAGSRTPYYLILYPRRPSGFPTQRQYQTYDRWFANVAHSFDVPGSAGPGEKP